MRESRIGLAVLVALTALGCSSDIRSVTTETKTASYDLASADLARTAMPPPPAAAPPTDEGPRLDKAIGAPVPRAMPRKIIYNAQVALVVESVTTIEQELERLCNEGGGYIAEKNISGTSHEKRQGSWKVRIPSDRFSAFLTSVGKLGEMQQNHVDSQDVTQEFYDLEARISNKQKEETRLQKHLDESTGKLEDILAVERELTRVRGEVEQMQGRLRYLANLSDLSTIMITASEIVDYKPPVAATFAERISRTYHESTQAVIDFAQGVVLLVVAVLPWLPVIALVVIPTWLIVRRRWVAVRQPRSA